MNVFVTTFVFPNLWIVGGGLLFLGLFISLFATVDRDSTGQRMGLVCMVAGILILLVRALILGIFHL